MIVTKNRNQLCNQEQKPIM